MTLDLKELKRLADAAGTDWSVSWYICTADKDDVAYAKKEGNLSAKVGDEMWRSAKSIGPISPEHDHWSGYSLGIDENTANFVEKGLSAIPDLIDEVERLREALRVYAGWKGLSEYDGGKLARQALENKND